MNIELWVIDHRDHDWQPAGDIIRHCHINGNNKYADFQALQRIWAVPPYTPGIVGFFGYRKYLLPVDSNENVGWIKPDHAPGWYFCDKPHFDVYRYWLSKYDGKDIIKTLAMCDILIAPPFPLTRSRDIISDFAESRSMKDAITLSNAMRKMNWRPTKVIYPYLFISRWEVFDRFMRETEEIRADLEADIEASDSGNYAYARRPMAYVMERIFSLWFEHAGLEYIEVPLLHCWEMKA